MALKIGNTQRKSTKPKRSTSTRLAKTKREITQITMLEIKQWLSL